MKNHVVHGLDHRGLHLTRKSSDGPGLLDHHASLYYSETLECHCHCWDCKLWLVDHYTRLSLTLFLFYINHILNRLNSYEKYHLQICCLLILKRESCPILTKYEVFWCSLFTVQSRNMAFTFVSAWRGGCIDFEMSII